MRVLDSHLHLWRLPISPQDSPYAWITPALGPLHRDVTAQEAEGELDAAGVGAVVLVQADDTVADTESMLQVCDRHDWAAATVGWVPLDTPEQASRLLDRWQQHRAFRGVRHLVHDDPRTDFLELPTVRRSLQAVSDRGLTLDVPDAFPAHLWQVVAIARDLPDLVVVLDHLGKPPLASGVKSTDFAAWAAQLRALAAEPRAVAKVSGLRIPGARYDVATLTPALDIALEAFGADRLMYGGDWPMTLPAGGYGPTLEVLQEWAAPLSPGEQAAIWHGTAERVYRLPS